jgi:hypothetical protein
MKVSIGTPMRVKVCELHKAQHIREKRKPAGKHPSYVNQQAYATRNFIVAHEPGKNYTVQGSTKEILAVLRHLSAVVL